MRDLIPKEHRCGLVDHPSLKVLEASIRSYLTKGLAELVSGDTTFAATAPEIYAATVCERVSELDNSLAALRLTLEFVEDLGEERRPDPDIYRYHYESFVLRVIGFADRAHRLVGTALCMPTRKVEGVRGNAFVRKQVAADHLDVHAALHAVSEAVDRYRAPRNQLIHAAAFSSRELGLFSAIKYFDVDTGDVDIDELARNHYSRAGMEIAWTIAALADTLKALLAALSPAIDATYQYLQGGGRESR